MFSANPTNIVVENGDSYIPASQRPDGTWRKARRVKEGYVPQEEVPLYESKGKQFMNRSSNTGRSENVVLPSGQQAQRIIPGLYILEEKDKKPLKKKNKNKEEDLSKKLESIKITEKPVKQTKLNQTKTDQQSSQQQSVDPAKRLKNLKKRLREVEALEEKLKSGLIAKPEPEQLAKVLRKNDLIMEVHELEKQIG